MEEKDKLDLIIESLDRIERKLKCLESSCERGENNFIREVGANVLGDYIYTVLDENWIRRNK